MERRSVKNMDRRKGRDREREDLCIVEMERKVREAGCYRLRQKIKTKTKNKTDIREVNLN